MTGCRTEGVFCNRRGLSPLSRLRRSAHGAQLSPDCVVTSDHEGVWVLLQMALEFFEPRLLLPFKLGVAAVIDLP